MVTVSRAKDKDKSKKNKKSHDKIRLLAFILGGMLVIALALIIATPRDTTTTPTKQTPAKSEEATDQPTAQTDGGSESPTSTTPQPTPTPTPAPQPATLANCQYESGPPSGRQCPATPPASYSTTVNCYGTSTEPITCPDWSSMRRITGTTIDGVSYCDFSFWGGGTSETYYRSKRVKVTNNANPNGSVDCSVEQALE